HHHPFEQPAPEATAARRRSSARTHGAAIAAHPPGSCAALGGRGRRRRSRAIGRGMNSLSATGSREDRCHDSPCATTRRSFSSSVRDEYLTTESPSTEQERKSVLKSVFADVGWECPQILAAIGNVSGVYFDSVSQIHMDRWTKGRTALVGAAAACVS